MEEDPSAQPSPSQRPSWRSRLFDLVLKSLAPLVVILILAGLYGWREAEVRIHLIEHSPFDSPSQTVSALQDPNPVVAAFACRELVEQQLVFSWGSVLPTLEQRPEIALGCIEARQKEMPKAVSEQIIPHHRVLAYRLSQRWFSQMMTTESASERVCALSGQTRKGFELAGADWRGPLMTCALSAASPEMRECCAETFDDGELQENLGDPLAYDKRLAETYLQRLAWIAFEFGELATDANEPSGEEEEQEPEQESGDAAPSEADADLGALATDVVVSVDRETLQDWVLEQGCRLLHVDADGATTIGAFLPLIESSHCSDSEDIPAAMYDKTSWLHACGGLYEFQRSLGAQAPAEAMCHALQQSVVDQVVSLASMHVGRASEVDLSQAYGDSYSLAPVHMTHNANPVVLGGSPNTGYRASAGQPMLRSIFSQFMNVRR